MVSVNIQWEKMVRIHHKLTAFRICRLWSPNSIEKPLSAAQFGRSVPWTVTEGPRTATKWRNCFFFNVFYIFTFETAQFAKRDQLKQISKKRPTIRYGVRGCHSDLNAPSLPHSGVWSALFTQASETQEWTASLLVRYDPESMRANCQNWPYHFLANCSFLQNVFCPEKRAKQTRERSIEALNYLRILNMNKRRFGWKLSIGKPFDRAL